MHTKNGLEVYDSMLSAFSSQLMFHMLRPLGVLLD